ncbi:MAG: pyridoxal phosphate-dependent aminotransferase, partial [Pyrinomonadaceae bacterium]
MKGEELPVFQPPARLRGISKSLIRQMFDKARPGSINLGLGEPDLPTPDCITDAAVKAIENEKNGYTMHAGLLPLRALVASDYDLAGQSLTPQQVIITVGSQEALYLTLMTLIDEGDEVLLPDPGFVSYPMIVKMAGGRKRFYRLPAENGFKFDLNEFKRALTPQTKVVVSVSPSNPTGMALSEDDLLAIAKTLEGTGVFVISDEIYRELYFGAFKPASISSYYPRTVIISGLSKSMSMTGWRLGWMCAEEDVIKSALLLHGYVTTCAPTISQKAAFAAWSDEAAVSREERRKKFAERGILLHQLITHELGLPAHAPDGAFYLMVDVR